MAVHWFIVFHVWLEICFITRLKPGCSSFLCHSHSRVLIFWLGRVHVRHKCHHPFHLRTCPKTFCFMWYSSVNLLETGVLWVLSMNSDHTVSLRTSNRISCELYHLPNEYLGDHFQFGFKRQFLRQALALCFCENHYQKDNWCCILAHSSQYTDLICWCVCTLIRLFQLVGNLQQLITATIGSLPLFMTWQNLHYMCAW